MEFHDKGAIANPHHGKNIIKLGLTAREKTDLVAIRKAFTGKTRVLRTPPKTSWNLIVDRPPPDPKLLESAQNLRPGLKLTQPSVD